MTPTLPAESRTTTRQQPVDPQPNTELAANGGTLQIVGCKVCHALDNLPDADAEQLDMDLDNPLREMKRIAADLTESGYPISRKSVERHVHGVCALGLRYRQHAA